MHIRFASLSNYPAPTNKNEKAIKQNKNKNAFYFILEYRKNTKFTKQKRFYNNTFKKREFSIFAEKIEKMKISYNWLKQYLNTNLPSDTISKILTDNGLEVEGIEEYEQIKGSLKGVVVGHVLECSHIEGTEHLSLTQVDVGSDKLQIVCGAPNVASGQKVLVALPDTTLYKSDGTSFKIKKTKIRGVESNGMICAEDELGLGTSHAGIIVLEDSAETGMPASNLYNISSDYIFEIGLTPNRSDAMCHTGVARDMAAALHNRCGENDVVFSMPSVDNFKVDNNDLITPVEVKNSEACIRYNGLTLTNLNVIESPDWLKRHLEAVGLRPINVVVDATQYVMLELGQPLHAFDYDKISGGKVIVQCLPDDTLFTTLDGVGRKLSSQDLMICDAEKGMCIAGVFGGEHSGVSMETKRVFLESACFNPVWVRKTAKYHGLHTDASFRFERGTDPEITVLAIKRVALLLKELTGCTISSEISDFYPVKIEKPVIKINIQAMNDFAGSSIPSNTIEGILTDLDFTVKNKTSEEIIVEAPLNRTDVTRPVDVYEEILRIYGYNNISMPEKSNTIYQKKSGITLNELIQKISNFLAAKGFNEIMCNSLNSLQWYEKAGVYPTDKIVSILNPLSRELNVMRYSMLPGMLQSTAYNINRNALSFKFFEIGKTYIKVSEDKEKAVTARFSESNILSLLTIGNERPENWKYKAEKTDFFNLKSVLEELFGFLGIIDSISIKTEVNDQFAYGISYMLNEKPLATFGLVKNYICKLSDIDSQIWYAELNLDFLLKKVRKTNIQYKEIPKYPAVRRDLALLINNDIPFETIQKTAFAAEKKLLRKVDLFDVYIDNKLGAGKKSYAVSFIFRHDDKTLTDAEVDRAMEQITKQILSVTGADIR
jgi:phenylalanyl-tRNA synthetase beta chain